MDIQTLTLIKLLFVAGLAWLSFRKTQRIANCREQTKIRSQMCMLEEVPLKQKKRDREESALSTSATTQKRITFEQYSSVYNKFMHHSSQSDEEEFQVNKANQQLSQDMRMEDVISNEVFDNKEGVGTKSQEILIEEFGHKNYGQKLKTSQEYHGLQNFMKQQSNRRRKKVRQNFIKKYSKQSKKKIVKEGKFSHSLFMKLINK